MANRIIIPVVLEPDVKPLAFSPNTHFIVVRRWKCRFKEKILNRVAHRARKS
jgi:hypothetical protein